jgi:hypothetical protein
VLEEQWIDSIDNAGSASLSQSAASSSASVLQGVIVGFFFPFLPFFFMRNRKPTAFWEDGNEEEPTSNVIFSSVNYSIGLYTQSLTYFHQTAHEDGFGCRFLHQCSIWDVALLAGLLIDTVYRYPYLSGLQTMIIREGQQGLVTRLRSEYVHR